MRRVAVLGVAALVGCQLVAGMGEHSQGGPCTTKEDCPEDQSCGAERHCVDDAKTGAGASGGASGNAGSTGSGGSSPNAGRAGQGAGGVAGNAGSGVLNAGNGQGGLAAGGNAGSGNAAPIGGEAGEQSGDNACPSITALTAEPSEGTTAGTPVQLAAEVTDDGGPSPVITYQWTAESGTFDSPMSPGTSFTCSATGQFTITLDVSDSACGDRATTTVTCVDATLPSVVINEVQATSTANGDWVELFNKGGSAADLSSFILKDNNDGSAYQFAGGTVLEPGAYLVIDEAGLGFALGIIDSIRLFDGGANLIDEYAWSAYPTTTFGRCPNATGPLTTTTEASQGQGNACPSLETVPWPGTDAVNVADPASAFGENLSGLTYERESDTVDVLWAVRNRPGALFRVIYDANTSLWTPDSTSGWSAGKLLHYADGTGNVDAEGVTRAELGSTVIYVATERDNTSSALNVSRPSILRFDYSGAGTELSATHEWNLVANLPVVNANLGLEAITWVPDSFLTDPAHRLFDEFTGSFYDPTDYPNHGTGLFFIGLEVNGTIYAFALDHTNVTYQRVATIQSGQPTIMSLDFDQDTGLLWAGCDDACNGQMNVLELSSGSASSGRFEVTHEFARPSSMANLVTEGFALAPESECKDGQKAAFWADDANANMHSLYRDTVPCGSL